MPADGSATMRAIRKIWARIGSKRSLDNSLNEVMFKFLVSVLAPRTVAAAECERAALSVGGLSQVAPLHAKQ
jgi:hypothetical protein